jgi:hypothetical protein
MTIPEIILVPLPGRNWRIFRDWEIQTKAAVEIYKDGIVKVPSGFVCDLNSMPRFLWWASTPTDYPEAGATHDFLYDQQVPQKVADDVYLEILLALGMPTIRAKARHRTLRLVGFVAYRKHAKPKPIVPPASVPHTDELPPIMGEEES